jgi:hypothetical protein
MGDMDSRDAGAFGCFSLDLTDRTAELMRGNKLRAWYGTKLRTTATIMRNDCERGGHVEIVLSDRRREDALLTRQKPTRWHFDLSVQA